MIRFDKVSRYFGDVQALSSFSLTVQPQSIYGLLGPNGAGKTTALRIALGLIRPSSGEVFLSGVSSSADPIGAKAVSGFLPASPSYYPHQTADDFLEFIARVRRLDDDAWRRRREFLLKRLCLLEARQARLSSYSFGMLRKAALAGALLHRPRHLLLDEPTAGLDPYSCRMLKDLLIREAANGTTVLFASHDLDAVAEISDRVGVIFRGKMVKELDGNEIPPRPQDGPSPLESIFFEATGVRLDEA